MTPCSPPTPGPAATNKSGRIVHCVKFQKDLPGLDAVPWPGELGQRIYESASQEAWKLWEERMKMILNEYRLMPWQKDISRPVSAPASWRDVAAGSRREQRRKLVEEFM